MRKKTFAYNYIIDWPRWYDTFDKATTTTIISGSYLHRCERDVSKYHCRINNKARRGL